MRWRGRDSGPRIRFRISPGRESIEGVAESLHSLVLLGRIWLEDGITFGSLSAFAMTAGGDRCRGCQTFGDSSASGRILSDNCS